MNYTLPTTAEIDGVEVPIRTDFRVCLEIIEALNDADLDDSDRSAVALALFYPDLDAVHNYDEALLQCLIFLDGGRERNYNKKSPRLMDWAQDFDRIIAPVNRVLGYEARAVPYDAEANTGGLHWWTFLAAYMEMGNKCLFSQIVNIREKLKRGKKLDKEERAWYNRNRDLVDLKTQYTEAEKEIEKEWT